MRSVLSACLIAATHPCVVSFSAAPGVQPLAAWVRPMGMNREAAGLALKLQRGGATVSILVRLEKQTLGREFIERLRKLSRTREKEFL